MRTHKHSRVAVIGVLAAIMACGDDGNPTRPVDAPPDTAIPPDAPPDPAVRGKYLVEHVSLCIDCHTPRNPDGSFDLSRYLAGAECFIDAVPDTVGAGCLHTRNLTNHPTGLMNRSDAEIREMFQRGVRPDGSYLVPVMPYWVFHNMTDDDANAIVAYLRTVPGVDHLVPASEPPFDAVPAAAPPVALENIPQPTTATPQTIRGRYLATQAGLCMECHTPRSAPGADTVLDPAKSFGGGEEFPIGGPFGVVTSRNLTPHPTGLGGMWTQQNIIDELKTGIDKNGIPLCPPMPAGPMAAYGGLADEDAADIAAYILALPPVDNTIATNCVPPMP